MSYPIKFTSLVAVLAPQEVSRETFLSTSGSDIESSLTRFAARRRLLKTMLKEAAEFCAFDRCSFAVYGHVWGTPSVQEEVGAEIIKYWRGVLPVDDIAELYSNAKVILGTTMTKQEELGMVNNRVFEVLSCGARLVIPKFQALEDLFAGEEERVGVHYVDGIGDTIRILENQLGRGSSVVAGGNTAGRKLIVRDHSWDNRAATILDIFTANRCDSVAYIEPNNYL